MIAWYPPLGSLADVTTRRRVASPRAAVAGLLAVVLMFAMLVACTSGKPKPKPSKTSSSVRKSSPSPSPSSSAAAAKIAFTNCTRQIQPSLTQKDQNRVARLSFFCGRLDVPLDYADPSQGTVQLYIVRVHDNSQVRRTGSLIVNPGGPGSSGVSLAIDLATSVSDDLLQHFDLIGFDPRGVFLSSALSCVSATQKDRLVGFDPSLTTTAGFDWYRTQYAAIASGCERKYGSTLPYYNTIAVARDLDLVRQGVGDPKLNYLGFSYGTLLGAEYAHLYPTTVRAAVLDGAVDPKQTPVQQASAQLVGFERAFDQFAAACKARSDCAALGDPRLTVPALIRKLNATPLHPKNTADRRTVTGAFVVNAAAAALYNRSSWDGLRSALIQARQGDPTGILALSDAYYQRDSSGHFTNQLDTQITFTCNDQRTAPTLAAIRALAPRWEAKYPVFGRLAASQLLRCVTWQPVRHPIGTVTASGSAPLLVVGTADDPATPYPQAAALARELGTGVVLTWQGQGHTAYPKTKCVQLAVDAYLDDATAPDAGTTCPAQ